MQPPRWKTITQSQYEWERRALDFLREGLPDHDPYRAWSNFEFQTKDGAIYEVDLLVLTKQGFWLIEIKSWPGRVRGDVGTWTREHEGRIVSEDNPLLLTNRKVKALKSLLSGQPSAKRVKIPWLEAVIFLSDEELKCDLNGPARNRVFLRDRDTAGDKPARNGILKAILNRDGQGIDPAPGSKIDIRVAKAVARAIEESGIRPSQKSRRVGDYILGDLIADGPGYQDRLAKHAAFETQEIYSRVRQYTVAQAATEETRKKLKRAAAREFQIIQTLNHPGILPVLDYKDHELGPALLFRYTDPHAERLDHYLARAAKSLDTDQRIELLRQIADAVRYAHSRRVVHRALAPQSVLVSDANSKCPTLQLYNWQVGYQQSSNVTATVTNIDDLVEAQSLVYMAPEALADPKKVSQASDIFSLGAIAFHLFSGRPPASNLNEMTQILQKRSGFSISSVVDGVGPRLEELIHWSTHKDALTRIGSVDEFLTFLADVEDELTAPDTSEVVDPLSAKRGNRLEHDYEVVRVLGQGATARALLVKKNEKEFVWKVALTEDDNRRLQDEAKALDTIHSEFVIKIHDTLEVAGKTVLVLQKAGEYSLAKHLRKYGVPSLDLLARYGENLLSAVKSLETHGIVHRDIKPDNIGIHSVNKQQNQLILYDFSLTSAPLENLHVGTPGYTDPFLKNRKSGKWDLAAERYSAAVTLYEMTLGDGQLPQWGDGSTDPAMTEADLVLEEEKFKPSVREGLVKFFRKALHRDSEQRFDNATDMLTDWLLIYKNADSQTVTISTGEEVKTSVPIEDVESSTAIAALDLSAPARDALEAINLISVEDLLRYRTNDIHMMRGVGGQYRREIIGFITELREKFPDIQAKTTSVTDDDAVPGLERLHDRVVGKRDAKKETDWNIRTGLLNTGSTSEPTMWPSQAEVADAHDVTRAKVGQVLAADLKRWGKDSYLNAFRTDLFEQLQRLGGAATVEDLIELTIMLRPSADSLTGDSERRFASTILRAAIETESSLSKSRYTMRRLAADSSTPERILIMATGHLDTNASSVDELSHTDDLTDYAITLGTVADRVAQTDPLLPRLRVFQELYDVPQPPPVPGCQPFSNDRLIKLAAAMSATAAVSSRQELYPRDMEALRALRLGIGALSGLGLGGGEGATSGNAANRGFTIEQVLDRVNSRYPEATSLPTDAKQLESMLQQVGLDVRWDASDEVFRRSETTILMTSGSSVGSRRSTATSTRHVDSSSPETVAARQTEDRLQHAFRDGGFLVLTVKPSYLRACEQNLLHRFPELERVSFDSLLLAEARAKSVEYEFPWNSLYETDAEGPGSEEWHNLLHLMSEVTPSIQTDLMNRKSPVLLVHPGLIARYELMSVLQTLRDRVGHDATCPSLWVLVASDSQSDMPYLDGVQIPLISTGQRADVSEYWVDNYHRGRSKPTEDMKHRVTEDTEIK